MVPNLLEYVKSKQGLQIFPFQDTYFEKLFYLIIYSGHYYANEVE